MRRNLVTAAITLALCGAASLASAQTPAEISRAANPPAVRATTQLPHGVKPSHYAIEVTPHADKMAFDGKVKISLDVLEPTSTIVLQAVNMSFANSVLTGASGKKLVPKVSVDAENQTATFAFAAPLAAGSYVLATDYTGVINTQANGLFAIDYDTDAGKQRALYTQFENSDARKFVPSWDEPNFKATFDLTVNAPAAQMAVSNMPVVESKDIGNGLKRVVFQTSPKMSTYLLFLGLGEFDRATDSVDGTEVGVVTPKGKVGQAAGALEASKLVLKEYNDYFGVKYPLPKLDNIAAPGRSQFFSAMENWGAIFTFEYALLVDPKISTIGNVQGIFSIAAHEIAHQWFGDLVTMSWWDDLWLNEGFATWMAARTTAKFHPEWKTELGAVGGREGAMSRDAVATTHPVVQKIETVEQASQAFDAITYSKGGAVIRALTSLRLTPEEEYDGADPEDPDEYKAENVFWVPKEARWAHLQASAKQPTVGKLVDDAMVAIERDNPRLKGSLNKNYGRADLDKHRLGELIDLIGSIQLGDISIYGQESNPTTRRLAITARAEDESPNRPSARPRAPNPRHRSLRRPRHHLRYRPDPPRALTRLRHLRDRSVRNPVVLTGDIHSNWANELAVEAEPAPAEIAVVSSRSFRRITSLI